MRYRHIVSTPAKILIGIVLAALVAGCATTKLTASWADPNFKGGPLKKLVVFVMYDDVTVRRVAEDRAVAQIPAGTQAVASYTLFEKLDKGGLDKIKKRLVDEGFDGALVTRLVSVDKDKSYIPPQTYFVATEPRFRRTPFHPSYYESFDSYYGFVGNQIYVTPGYLREDTVIRLETILYGLPANKAVWSATSESMNPRSPEAVAGELAKLIVKELGGRGIVGMAGAEGAEKTDK